MIVYLEPVSGTAKDNLDRAKVQMESILGFRGKVLSTRAEGDQIAVTIEVNSKWDLPEKERMLNLEEWIRAKTRKFHFQVQSIK